MADITFVCSQCNATRMASEFVDAAKIKCNKCGAPMHKEGEAPPPAPTAPLESPNAPDPNTPVQKADAPIEIKPPQTGASRLKLAKQQREKQEAAIAAPEPVSKKDKKSKKKKQNAAPAPATPGSNKVIPEVRAPLELHPKKDKGKKKKVGPNHTLFAFLLFGVLGFIAFYFRYQTVFPEQANYRVMVQPFAWIVVLTLHTIVTIKALSDNMFQGILCLLVPGWSLIYLLFISDYFYLRATVLALLIAFGQDGGIQIAEWSQRQIDKVNEFMASGGGEIRRDENYP